MKVLKNDLLGAFRQRNRKWVFICFVPLSKNLELCGDLPELETSSDHVQERRLDLVLSRILCRPSSRLRTLLDAGLRVPKPILKTDTARATEATAPNCALCDSFDLFSLKLTL